MIETIFASNNGLLRHKHGLHLKRTSHFMNVIFYDRLDTESIKGLDKLISFIENDDFRSADIKKIGTNLYRARLDITNRLLLSIHSFDGEKYALILEYLPNHSYEKSKFLKRGVKVDEQKIPAITQNDIEDAPELPHISKQKRFHYLDKIISFDPEQRSIYEEPLPLVIIGSAGSGKSALLLEKMKSLNGTILYVTESSYLREHSEIIYHHHPSHQNKVTFLTFQDYIESIRIPNNRLCTKHDFLEWFSLHKKNCPIKDGQALFEEIRGVLTADLSSPIKDYESYLGLGIKQSIFNPQERPAVYQLFRKYLDFLNESDLFDPNIICHTYHSFPKKQYDFVIIDEIQDLTLVQTHLILQSCQHPEHFIIAGDANQIVHPNFFSWTNIKSLFFETIAKDSFNKVTRILSNNYRNSHHVTHFSNQLLKLKHQRFGSIDRESHYLMKSTSRQQGSVKLIKNTHSICKQLNLRTQHSVQHAVITLDKKTKQKAKALFDTPLIFTVQECKGLEYKNIILFNIVTEESKHFHEIGRGISPADLEKDFTFSRNRDKTDKSLEKLKFYINALYVACTRAEENLYILEEKTQSPFIKIIAPQLSESSIKDIDIQQSSFEDWRKEADRLEKSGQQDQADAIRKKVLQQSTPDWDVYAGANIGKLYDDAINFKNKRAKLALFEYALVYEDHRARNALLAIDYKPASDPFNGLDQLYKKYFLPYQQGRQEAVLSLVKRYGVDYRNPFNQTPLIISTWLGKPALVDMLLKMNADRLSANNKGLIALQVAIEKGCMNPGYASEIFLDIYRLLCPNHLVIRLGSGRYQFHRAEKIFFLMHAIIALFYRLLPDQMISGFPGYSADSIANAIQVLPDQALPLNVKNRDVVYEVLQTYSDENNNYPLLLLRTGEDEYMPNPSIQIKVEQLWLNIYDVLWFDDLSIGNPTGDEDIMPQEAFDSLFESRKIALKYFLGI